MHEVPHDLRIVNMAVPVEHVPELLTVLGDFVTRHSIAIEVREPGVSHEPRPSVSPQYNELLVRHVKLGEGEDAQAVDVITRDSLGTYTASRDVHERHLSSRAITAIQHAYTRRPAAMQPYVAVGNHESPGAPIVGLRADKLQELMDRINRADLVIDISDTIRAFLSQAAADVYVNDSYRE